MITLVIAIFAAFIIGAAFGWQLSKRAFGRMINRRCPPKLIRRLNKAVKYPG
jgi:hypothetical protein